MEYSTIFDYVDTNFQKHLSRVQEFLRIPSISGEYPGITDASKWLAEYLETLGFDVELAGDNKAPIIYGRLDLGRPRTLLVYGMYDVQPVTGQQWASPPFDASIQSLPEIGPCIIARGACNSKAPFLGFLNAIEACKQVDQIPVNLIVTIEGEEEAGSPNLPEFYRQNKPRLKADAGFEPFWAEYGTDVHHPIVSLGSKGVISLEIICRGGTWGGPTKYPIHSSVGAWIASPIWRLIQALNTFVGEDEAIGIEGFQDGVTVRPEDEELLAALAQVFDERSILDSMGVERFKHSLHGVDLLRKYLFSPTISIGSISKNDVDAINPEVRAKILIRLVPRMDPQRTIETIRQHLDAHGYDDIEIRKLTSYPFSQTSIKEKVVQCMLDTYQEFGIQPQIWPLSASATPYYLFSDTLGIPYTWGGLGRAGRSHAPDEYCSIEGLKLFEKSIVTFLNKFAKS